MYFPKYWTKAEFEGPNREGETARVEAWGWSDLSVEDARQKALMRAQAILPRIPMGSGRGKQTAYYENSPCRESILQDSIQGGARIVVTRNSLGCEVLNTEDVGFADLDNVPVRTSIFASMFDFGGKKAAARKAEWESKALESLRAWQKNNLTWTFRVYRTAGGLRLLATSKLLKPDALESKAWLEAVGSDPLYQTLCRNQKSFRARLTPKAWRCGVGRCPVRSIWEGTSKEAEMSKWLEVYQQKASHFAVCEYLETMGSASVLREIQPLVTFHDEKTLATSRMPLA